MNTDNTQENKDKYWINVLKNIEGYRSIRGCSFLHLSLYKPEKAGLVVVLTISML